MKARKLPQPFKFRGGYRAQVTVPGTGTRRTGDFSSFLEAKRWIEAQHRDFDVAKNGRLGGPGGCTFVTFLREYAIKDVALKAGHVQEINRINAYLEAVGEYRLKVVLEGKSTGVVEIEEARSVGMAEYLSQRRADIEPIYELKAELASKNCDELSKDDFSNLMSVMGMCGNSPSTIQKEIALIRAAFNVAIERWGWTGYENPAAGLPLGKSATVIPTITDDQLKTLFQMARGTESLMAATTIELAVETLLRKSALLNMKWKDIDFQSKKVQVAVKKARTKGAELVFIPLSDKAIELLQSLPTFGCDGKVFDGLRVDALDGAFERARTKAGLGSLRFHDLRHIGATLCARAGMSANHIRLMLGHKTLFMSLVYVNLVAQDASDFINSKMQGSVVPA
jgi:integrase